MDTMNLSLDKSLLNKVRNYEDGDETEVFTYEIGKYFDYMDDWYTIGDTLCIVYDGVSPNKTAVKERIKVIADWV